ncbi:MAG: hypothetical protein KC493_12780 [Bacteriovoracaceae bacterium]|nr:hypothetical protein [Bacteriovoracaceae bacterium]
MRSAIEEVVETIWENSLLKSNFIKVFCENGYIPGHSSLCLIMSWLLTRKNFNGEPGIFRKFAFSSIFHDIVLEDDSSACLLTLKEIEESSLSASEKKYIVQHPLNSVEKLEPWDIIDSDTIRIIKEHHELPAGNGFPKQLPDSSSHKLSSSFQFVLNLSHLVYFSKGEVSDLTNNLESSFNLEKYKNFLEVFKRV